MSYLITTTDPHRRRLWQRLFGQETLPVLHPYPRWQWLPGHQRETLAYDLALKALPAGARDRLAAYVAWRAGWPYDYAQTAVKGGWAIPAANCRPAAQKREPLPASARPHQPSLPFAGATVSASQ